MQKLLFVTTMWSTGGVATKQEEEAREREYRTYLHQWTDKGASLLRFDLKEGSETGKDPFTKIILDSVGLVHQDTGQNHASRVVKG